MLKYSITVLIHLFLIALFPSLSGIAEAETTYEGVSGTSLGRFAAWPCIVNLQFEHYEGDLVKRVYADRIQRSGITLGYWKLYFGAKRINCSIGDIPHFILDDDTTYTPTGITDYIWAEDQNWVYKKFAVVRDNADTDSIYGGTGIDGKKYTYEVSVNSLSPGTRITTAHREFYLENDEYDNDYHLGYIAYHHEEQGNDSYEVMGDFSGFTDPDSSVTVQGENIEENWVLFFDSSDNHRYNRAVPVMISFSDRPDEVKCYRDSIKFTYPDNSDQKTFFISLPFGVDRFSYNTISVWVDSLPDSVVDQCRDVNRIVNNWPVDADENFSFEEVTGATPDNVCIENTFTYSYMGQDWESTGYVDTTQYSLLPPLVVLAEAEGIISDAVPSDAEDIGNGYPTKYGRLMIVDQSSSTEYIIPGPPEHDIHLVGTPNDFETEWKQRVNRLINIEYLSSMKFISSTHVGGAATNKGELACLAMTRDWTREHVIDFMEQTVENRMFYCNGSGSENYTNSVGGWQKWDWADVPSHPSGSWNDYNLWSLCMADKDVSQPWDMNAFAGMCLEFLYEYGLWSGDWTHIDLNWEYSGSDFTLGVKDIFYPLPLFHDWGYMSSSYCVYGSQGGIMDMFPAEIAAYHSFFKMADVLSRDQDAAFGRYLAAKSQIPFVTRWAAKDYVSDYYNIAPCNQVIEGFGEQEPSGPMSNAGNPNFNKVRTVDSWADWTISGERIHLTTFDILSTLTDTDNSFSNYLDDFYSIRGSILENNEGSFPEDKLYCFYKWKKYDLRSRLKNDMNSLYSSSPGDMNGPTEYYPEAKIVSGWNSSCDVSYPHIGGEWGRRFALVPALAETYRIPIRIGAWAPAKLDSAYYDPDNGKLTAYLSGGNGSSADPVVRLQADSNPGITIQGNHKTTESAWDSFWKVKEVYLEGNDSWIIEANINPSPGELWTEVPPVHNLVSDPGFEDCGESPNFEMPWKKAGTLVESTNENQHSGYQCARLGVPDSTSYSQLWQDNIWVRPVDPPSSIPLDLDFWYDISSTDLILKFRVFEISTEVNTGGSVISDSCFTRLVKKDIHIDSPDSGWQHFELPEPIYASPDSAVIMLRFSAQKKYDVPWQGDSVTHRVEIDDINLTCSLLDTGSDPEDPPGGGGGKDDPQPVFSAMPLLSGFNIFPNPFNPTTSISFQLGRKTHVRLKMFDPRGRLVKTLINRVLPTGPHTFEWNGTNNRGNRISSGVYFYRLEIEDIERKGKLVLLR